MRKFQIKCFELDDEMLEPEEFAEKINYELRARNISAENVMSFMQPMHSRFTRVIYKELVL